MTYVPRTRYNGGMEWLNYHHLQYFYVVAREGTISAASDVLNLAPSTISVQIKTLEDSLEMQLFEREGRNLHLTAEGRLAYQYAEEIFSLGNELLDTLKSRPIGRPQRLTVGIADVLWKDIAYQLIRPATRLTEPIHITCVEGTFDELLAELSVHHVDVVIADAPLGPTVSVRAHNHQLGSSGVSIFGPSELVDEYREDFPKSLEGAPMLLPTSRTALRRSLEHWFDAEGFAPRVVGEFDDSALMTSFAQAGDGLFPAPSVVELDITARGNLELLGAVERVNQRFYAISVDRKIKHPGVQAICEAARQSIFA